MSHPILKIFCDKLPLLNLSFIYVGNATSDCDELNEIKNFWKIIVILDYECSAFKHNNYYEKN